MTSESSLLVPQAAAGDLDAQRKLAAGVISRLNANRALTPRQTWLGEMWARLATAHPDSDHGDLARLSEALELAAQAADDAGEEDQAGIYRAEIISLTAEIADGDSPAAEDAALQLEKRVAGSTPTQVRVAQAMRRPRNADENDGRVGQSTGG